MNLIFHVSIPGMKLLLPLGISFYTFQSSGYLLDVYWKRDTAEKNPFRYALFVSYFPQILQGPVLDDTVKWQGSCMKDINLN